VKSSGVAQLRRIFTPKGKIASQRFVALRLLLLQARTKQTYEISLKTKIVDTRLFSTKTKIASASPAIA